MPANPLRVVMDYLRGSDLKAVPMPTGTNLAVPTAGAPTGYGWLNQPGMQGVFSTDRWDGGEYEADGNSAVFACLLTLADAHIEPPLKVMRQTDPEADPIWLQASPMQALLDEPNPWHDNLELWWWTQYARHCDGNAYLRKVRAGDELTGNVVELWPISPRLVEPVTLDGSRNFIDYYDYTYAPGKHEKIPTENMVHYRIGIDDRDHRLGLAPIKRLVRLIASDEEAVRFADALLHNFGVPGLVVQVPEQSPITENAALELKASIQNTFGTEGRGNVGVLAGGASMQQFGFSPQDLNLEILHNVPEARIAAVMRVPPAVAGLGVGLDQTANFASLKAVYEAFTERVLVPTWRLDAAKLNKQLKPDFTPDRTTLIVHDLSRVRSLQDDVDAQYRRLDMGVRGYWIRPSEARIDVGKPADPELDALWLARATSAPGGAFGVPAAAKGLPETKDDAQTLDDFPELVQTMLDAAAPRLEAQLNGYFDDQRKRVKRALLSGG
jgi:HK97 family phage portal protein